ncbi:MAG TPA: hypothetical protein VGI29_06120 [Candidatus Binataceae bacterium]|jgi:hypothetical protein
MNKRKVKFDARKISLWHFAVFAMGAVVGSILGGFYGAAYTSAAVIVTCWFTALMLVAFDRSRVRAPRSSSADRRWQSPLRAMGADSAGAAPPKGRRGGATAVSLEAARRTRLRTIAGGKSEPPWRAS